MNTLLAALALFLAPSIVFIEPYQIISELYQIISRPVSSNLRTFSNNLRARFKTCKLTSIFNFPFPLMCCHELPPGIVDVALALLTAEAMLRADGPQVIVVYAGGAHIRNQAGFPWHCEKKCWLDVNIFFCNHKLGFLFWFCSWKHPLYIVEDHRDFLLRLALLFAFPFQHFGLLETFQVRLTTYWYHNICIEYVTVDKLSVK